MIGFCVSRWEFYRPGEIADMTTSSLVLFGFVLCAASAFSQTESEIRDRIVGTWKLVSAEEIMKDGSIRPFPAFGPHGKGFLMYQQDGYMCAEMVNPDRQKWADPAHATAEEKARCRRRRHSLIVAGTRSTPGKSKLFTCRKWPPIRDTWDRAKSGLLRLKAEGWCSATLRKTIPRLLAGRSSGRKRGRFWRQTPAVRRCGSEMG